MERPSCSLAAGGVVTVGVAYRVPGLGAVVACDSRITDTESGMIYSDHVDKWLIGGSVVACYSGTAGGLWGELREASPRTWADLRKALIDIDATESHDRDYDALAYDRRTDTLWHTDHQGDAVRKGVCGTIGIGGTIALGVLEASPTPKTLEAAERLVRRAIKVACKHNSSCGGRTRVLVVRGKRGAILVR